MSKSSDTNSTPPQLHLRSFSQILQDVRRRQLEFLSSQKLEFRRDLFNSDDNEPENNSGEHQKIINISQINFTEYSESAIIGCSHPKGHPFCKLDKKTTEPKFWLLENFQTDDFCFFKPDLLLEKIEAKGWGKDSCELCILLIRDSIDFSIEKKYTNRAGLSLMEIMFQAYNYLMANNFATKDEFYDFYRSMILLYAVDDPPVSMAIFSPMQCFVISHFFWEQFDPIYLLLKAIAVPNYVIKIFVDKNN